MTEPDVADTPCPSCGVKALEIEQRFEAKPLGTWSLAGEQQKYAGTMWPYLVCRNCKIEARGKRTT